MTFDPAELQGILLSLTTDHDDLGVRVRRLEHQAKCQNPHIRMHGHYFAFREGKPTVAEFVELLSTKLISFCMSRKSINAAHEKLRHLSPQKQFERATALRDQAVDLFKRAQRNTNRNGEFGEVITYLLIEHVLKAPQLVAKMSLKTSREMPVHGSDGVHFSFDPATGGLTLLWGESKCYASVANALSEAVKSVAENLQDDKMKQEIFLVREHGDLSAFSDAGRDAIMSFLDPYAENYNQRIDGSVILVAFDFERFADMNGLKPADVDNAFQDALRVELDSCATRLDAQLKKNGIEHHTIDVFFLPVPSVQDLRMRFQHRIGWAA
ncbi:HamA C-terminal domain-containing protein [Methylobacterium sp. 22177]|uniref:HamA C-terminal domain-containing protein n=1 Tax=Methylobacterium sp. 22177 TaxID=3453885 RepID=UPI003F8701D1